MHARRITFLDTVGSVQKPSAQQLSGPAHSHHSTACKPAIKQNALNYRPGYYRTGYYSQTGTANDLRLNSCLPDYRSSVAASFLCHGVATRR